MRLAHVCAPLLLITVIGTASAGPALDEGQSPPPPPSGGSPTPAEPSVAAAAGEQPIEYGVGLRLRNVRIPKGEIELFVDRAGNTGSSSVGFGIDLTRRRGNVELQLGFETEAIKGGEGIWIESGKNIATGDVADYVLPAKNQESQLRWYTLEFTFLNHAVINKYISFRYGGGAGLGIVGGKLQHLNMVCAGTGATNEMPLPCEPNQFGGHGNAPCEEDGAACGTLVKYNIPPVFPVVNAIIGLQFRPTDKMTINLEGGIRTFLFFGTSASYFF